MLEGEAGADGVDADGVADANGVDADGVAGANGVAGLGAVGPGGTTKTGADGGDPRRGAARWKPGTPVRGDGEVTACNDATPRGGGIAAGRESVQRLEATGAYARGRRVGSR